MKLDWNFDNNEMVKDMSIDDFRNAGFLFMVNQQLQFFGLSLAITEDDTLVPVQSKFRGFSEESITNNHKKVAAYLEDNVAGIVESGQ